MNGLNDKMEEKKIDVMLCSISLSFLSDGRKGNLKDLNPSLHILGKEWEERIFPKPQLYCISLLINNMNIFHQKYIQLAQRLLSIEQQLNMNSLKQK
ncbi:MAG: hypothetical protein ACP5UA_05070 [Candidatus Hydrogenedens sp.]